jgi:hypothetical protein
VILVVMLVRWSVICCFAGAKKRLCGPLFDKGFRLNVLNQPLYRSVGITFILVAFLLLVLPFMFC